MKNTYRKYWLVVLVLLGLQGMQAQFVEDALRLSQFSSAVGARSLAMGNTNVGVANDFSALFSNPAGLAQQKNFEFSAGLSRYGYGNDVTYLGTKTTDDNNAINLNNLGIVYPIATVRGGLTFAFGFGRATNFTGVASFDGFNPSSSIIRSFRPYAGTQYEDFDLLTLSAADARDLLNQHLPFQLYLADTLDDYLFPLLTDSVQQSVKIIEKGGLNHWSFGGGIDIAENLSFGITLTFVSGSYSYDREFTESDPRNIYRAFPYNFNTWTYTSTIHSDIKGFNALFGLMYNEPRKFRIGGTVRIPTTYEITETFTDNGVSAFDDGFTASYALPDGETEYKVTTPFVLSFGASAYALDWLMIAADAEYTDWASMEFDTENPDLVAENRYIKNAMRETWNLRGGAEASLKNAGLKIRAGVEWKQSPWKDDPADYDQWSYTAGLGYAVDEASTINISYALGSWKTFRDNYTWGNTPASRTNEIVSTHTVNLTFSHTF